MTVLFADIRGFTSLAERIQPEDCVQLLNDYFCTAVDEIIDCAGTVDRFQGDCVMARFEWAAGTLDHAYRAVRCAVRLREAVRSLRIPQMPQQRIRLGIGVNTGMAVVAAIGSHKRTEFTAIGDAINIAHRLQALSKPDQILISENTERRMGGVLKVENLGCLYLRGRTEPINAFAV
jgi:adenylate cyclase